MELETHQRARVLSPCLPCQVRAETKQSGGATSSALREISDQRLSGDATITDTDLDQTPTHEGINNAVVILTIQW